MNDCRFQRRKVFCVFLLFFFSRETARGRYDKCKVGRETVGGSERDTRGRSEKSRCHTGPLVSLPKKKKQKKHKKIFFADFETCSQSKPIRRRYFIFSFF